MRKSIWHMNMLVKCCMMGRFVYFYLCAKILFNSGVTNSNDFRGQVDPIEAVMQLDVMGLLEAP